MNTKIRTLALSALAALTLAAGTGFAAASSFAPAVTTFDAQGGFSFVATLDANEGGMTTHLYVPSNLLGLQEALGTDESAKVQLTAVSSAVDGLSFELDSAVIASTALQSDMLRFDVIAYTDGLQSNGVYPVVLTFKNTQTGQSIDVQAKVVVTNNVE